MSCFTKLAYLAIGLGVPAILTLTGCSGCGCDDPAQSEDEIARALADKLTDSLGFEGATTVEGAPPAEHGDSSAHPQVMEVQAPGALSGGQVFAVSMFTAFSKPAEVKGAIVYVDKAGKYLEIGAALALDPKGLVMLLAGALKGDPAFIGKSFPIKLAMFDVDKAVGNYMTWTLTVKNAGETAPTTQQLQGALSIDGGSAVAGSIPGPSTGAGADQAPKILALETPEQVGPGREFLLTVRYTSIAPVASLYLQVGNSTSYVKVAITGGTQTDGDGSLVFAVAFDPSKLGVQKTGLATAGRALSTIAATGAGIEAQSITLKAAIEDQQKRVGKPAERRLVFTTESGACKGKGCDTTVPDGGTTDGGDLDAAGDAGSDAGADIGMDGGEPADAGADAGSDAGDGGAVEDTGPPDSGIDAGTADGGCTPDCAKKSCGDDGCGGTCGSCSAPDSCGGTGSPGVCGAATGTHLWSKRVGGAGDDWAYAAATNAAGEVAITGFVEDGAEIDGATIKGAGGWDAFVAVFGTDGKKFWSTSFGGTGNDKGSSLAFDGMGNLYVTGMFDTSMDLGQLQAKGGADLFVAKWGPGGMLDWVKGIGGAKTETPGGLAVDAQGAVYVTGAFSDTVDFGDGAVTGAGGPDIFVVKYSSAGIHQWSKTFGGGDYGAGVAVDAAGSVYVTGEFQMTVDFGGGGVASDGSSDAFLVRLDAVDGAFRWVETVHGPGYDRGAAVATNARGQVIVAGFYSDTATLAGNPVTSNGLNDIFVAAFDATKQMAWTKAFGGQDDDRPLSIAVDRADNVLLAGYFQRMFNPGPAPLTGAGLADAFMVKYAPEGTALWSRGFGSTGIDQGKGIACDASGGVFFTGSYSNNVNFGGQDLASRGLGEVFLGKYAP